MVPSHLNNRQDTAAFSADDNGITLESIESIVVMQSPFDRYQSSLLATTFERVLTAKASRSHLRTRTNQK